MADNIDFMDLNNITISSDHLINVRQNIEFNKSVLKHYRRLLFNSRFNTNYSFREKTKKRKDFTPSSVHWNSRQLEKVSTLENKIQNLSSCNSLWLLNVYDKQKIKDFIKTNLCKDRFCSNCKKVKQASRMARFTPEIDKYGDVNKYHLTLTVPNVKGHELRFMVDVMFKAFARLVNYFKATKKYYISGVDFEKFNYMGAIRSLEVTFKNGSFHPHIHSLFLLDFEDTKKKDKKNVNKFSIRNGKLERKFSDSEILIQKVWKLLIIQEMINKTYQDKINFVSAADLSDKQKEKQIKELEKELKNEIRKNPISKKAIDSLELGFSCTLDKFEEDDYHELFKYMTKAQNDNEQAITYQDFLYLYFELKSVRQIQGYGCFFRLKDEDMEDVVDINYDTLISILDSVESPRQASEKIEDLYLDRDYTLISRKKIFGYLREIEQKEKEGLQPSLKNG